MTYDQIIEKWRSYSISKEPDIDKYLHSFKILFAYIRKNRKRRNKLLRHERNIREWRTLMNYYLMIQNHPPVIIYEEDKKKYYDALNIFDEKLIIDDLYNFLKEECIKTWKSWD